MLIHLRCGQKNINKHVVDNPCPAVSVILIVEKFYCVKFLLVLSAHECLSSENC